MLVLLAFMDMFLKDTSCNAILDFVILRLTHHREQQLLSCLKPSPVYNENSTFNFFLLLSVSAFFIFWLLVNFFKGLCA